jgi:hypothetical protein
MSSNPRSLLTPSQREYLKGESEPSNESQMRSRIRDRVYNSLSNDAGVLMDGLSREDRRRIFRNWEDKNVEDERNLGKVASETYMSESSEWAEKSSFRINLADLLAFVYLGVEESGVGSFEELLESAMDKVAKEDDQFVSSFSFKVEFEQRATGKDVFEALAENQISVGDLPISRIHKLVNSNDVDWRDLPEEQQEEIKSFYQTARSLNETDFTNLIG